MKHQPSVVLGSTKRSAVGGLEYVVSCCGVHQKSVHIQQPGKFTQAELVRIRDQHLADIAAEHANEEAAIAFMVATEKDCGCST